MDMTFSLDTSEDSYEEIKCRLEIDRLNTGGEAHLEFCHLDNDYSNRPPFTSIWVGLLSRPIHCTWFGFVCPNDFIVVESRDATKFEMDSVKLGAARINYTSIRSYFRDQVSVYENLDSLADKRYHLLQVIKTLVSRLETDAGVSLEASRSFPSTPLPFYLVGWNSSRELLEEMINNQIDWDDYMRFRGSSSDYIEEFKQPDELLVVIENRLDDLLTKAIITYTNALLQ